MGHMSEILLPLNQPSDQQRSRLSGEPDVRTMSEIISDLIILEHRPRSPSLEEPDMTPVCLHRQILSSTR